MSRSVETRFVPVMVFVLLACLLSGTPVVVSIASAQAPQAESARPAEPQGVQPPGAQASDTQPQGAQPQVAQPQGAPAADTQPQGTQAPGTQPPGIEPQLPPPAKPSTAAAAQSVAKLQEELLLRENFTFIPAKMLDPFSPAITPTETPVRMETDDEDGAPPEPKAPLTPLQKMSVGEIEKGLKAIMWGEMGRRALIEDASGKGYIVGEGTAVGDHEGVVTQIFNDHLVIQQEFWDKTAKKSVAQNSVVRLQKMSDKK